MQGPNVQPLAFKPQRDALRAGQRKIVEKTEELRTRILRLDKLFMRPEDAEVENIVRLHHAEICSDPGHPEFSNELTLVHLLSYAKEHVLKFRNAFFEVTTTGVNEVQVRLVKPLPAPGCFGRGQFFCDNRVQTVKMWTGGGKAVVEGLDAASAETRAWMWHTNTASKDTNKETMKPDTYSQSGLVRHAGFSEEAMKRIKKETVALQRTQGTVSIDVMEHKFVLAHPSQFSEEEELGPDTFDVIVVDEGDYGAQQTTQAKLQGGNHWYRALEKFPYAWVTFYTATDERSDSTARRNLPKPFVKVTHAELLEVRHNKGITVHTLTCMQLEEEQAVQTPVPGLKDLQAGFWKNSETSTASYSACLEEHLDLVVKQLVEDRAKGRMPGLTLVFVNSKPHLEQVEECLKKLFQRPEYECPLLKRHLVVEGIHCEMANAKIKDKKERFMRLKIDVLVSIDTLKRSFDCPLVTAELILEAVQSYQVLAQMLGRSQRHIQLDHPKVKQLMRYNPEAYNLIKDYVQSKKSAGKPQEASIYELDFFNNDRHYKTLIEKESAEIELISHGSLVENKLAPPSPNDSAPTADEPMFDCDIAISAVTGARICKVNETIRAGSASQLKDRLCDRLKSAGHAVVDIRYLDDAPDPSWRPVCEETWPRIPADVYIRATIEVAPTVPIEAPVRDGEDAMPEDGINSTTESPTSSAHAQADPPLQEDAGMCPASPMETQEPNDHESVSIPVDSTDSHRGPWQLRSNRKRHYGDDEPDGFPRKRRPHKSSETPVEKRTQNDTPDSDDKAYGAGDNDDVDGGEANDDGDNDDEDEDDDSHYSDDKSSTTSLDDDETDPETDPETDLEIDPQLSRPKITPRVTSIQIAFDAKKPTRFAILAHLGVELDAKVLDAHETVCTFSELEPNTEYTITCDDEEVNKIRTKPSRKKGEVTAVTPTPAGSKTKNIKSVDLKLVEEVTNVRRMLRFPRDDTAAGQHAAGETAEELDKEFPDLFYTAQGKRMPREGDRIRFKPNPSPATPFVWAHVLKVEPVVFDGAPRNIIQADRREFNLSLNYKLRLEDSSLHTVELDPDMHDWSFGSSGSD
jgi:hypothetical protein